MLKIHFQIHSESLFPYQNHLLNVQYFERLEFYVSVPIRRYPSQNLKLS